MLSFWDHLEELRRVLLRCIVVVAVFVLYQFVTADLQPFIYFQF